jgi:hypothetical protein
MTVDFSRIRPHHGSQHDGFEELSCQLAGCERPPGGVRFVRNAPPDGGVECYWVLQNGCEHGWQAKFFDVIEDSQWRQLDESVETVLKKHPHLVRYVVCLPIDLPDARSEGRRSLREKWEERVGKWRGWANQRGMNVAFELWGEHELLTRLAEPAQAGRRQYWFGGEVFSPDWFTARFREAVRYAGERYTPTLHVELPLSRAFEGLGYTPTLLRGLRERLERVCERWRALAARVESQDVASALGDALVTLRERYADAVRAINCYGDIDDCPRAADTLKAVEDAATAAYQAAYALRRPSLAGTDAAPRRPRVGFDYEASLLLALAEELEELASYCAEPDLQLIDRPALLLIGPGGYGKTHALCDLADRRVAAGQPTVLLLGQQLGGGDPWQAILGRLGLRSTRDEFLGAMQAAGEAARSRALILLDAINEAPEVCWRDELPAMIEVLRGYPRLAFAVSCRDVAEEELIRPDIGTSGFVRVEHTGMLGRLDEAIERFGRAYEVAEMHVPMLSPEFQSPLFLKLFFRARQAHRGALASAFNGLAELFDTVVRDLNERLSKRDQLNYHPSERRVQRGIERLATLMVDGRRKAVPSGQALDELRQIHPATDYSESLLCRLIGEGILAEDVVRQGGENERVVRFSYDRLGEHVVARVLLSRVRAERAAGATDSSTLRWFLQDEQAVARQARRGLIIAACAIAPTDLGRELFEAAPWVAAWPSFARLYLASLAVRPPSLVGAACVAYVEGLLRPGSGVSSEEVYSAVLEVAVIPQHALNARWLHRHLRSCALPERDAAWSMFLHQQWGHGGPVRRLLDWAWPEDCEARDPAGGVDTVTVQLAALCLGWYLTTPNRFLRDRATKALVSLLHRRVHEVVFLLRELGQVDDPYVVERVYAVAYGCAMRSGDVEGVAALGRMVFAQAFAGQAPADVLTRDYARGCVERALCVGAIPQSEVEVSRLRPPYVSVPLVHPPTWEELQQAYPKDRFSGLYYALESRMSDFVRYVLDPLDIGCDDGWTDDPNPPAREERPAYTDEELEAVRQLIESVGQQFHVVQPGEQADDEEGPPLDNLLSAEPPSPREESDEGQGVQPAAAPAAPLPDTISSDYAARWIFRRVLELGWTPERFGEFDREVSRFDSGRSAHKPERMGKKYQWIALKEFMGSLLDRRIHRHRNGESETYDGPWQLGLRDTDPSLLTRGRRGNGLDAQPSTWWVPMPDPVAPGSDLTDSDWLRLLGPLPDFRSLAKNREPGSGREWACLALDARWQETAEVMEARRGTRLRRVGFNLGTWLVPRQQASALLAELVDWDFSGFDVLGIDLHDLFLGEYCWAPSFEHLRRDAGWTFGSAPESQNTQTTLPRHKGVAVVTTTHRYLAEGGGYDCSLPESVSGALPSVWLAGQLGVMWARRHFRCSADGRDVTFDPSAEFGGPPALLICRERLTRFLRERDLTLIAAVVGEKNVYQPHNGGFDEKDWPGHVVFRRLLRDDGEGATLAVARTLLLNRKEPHEEELERVSP